MIKVKTKFDNKEDVFSCTYKTKKTHTLEHLALLARVWWEINKNDPLISDEEIYKRVLEYKKQLIIQTEED